MQTKIHFKDRDFELTVEGDKKTVASVFWGTLERWFPAPDVPPVKIIEEGDFIEKALSQRGKPKPARVKKAAAKPKPTRVDGEYSIVKKADGTTYKRLKRRWFKKPKDADKSAALAPAPAAVPVPKKKVPAAP
ncbi:MAG: hypothetical protein HY548_04515, partial [Elusimicrobia bacterium]|nr:hypothetical protein [Elusimicrobiota bacterium]